MAKKKVKVKRKVGVRKKKIRKRKKPLTSLQKIQKNPKALYGLAGTFALLLYFVFTSNDSSYSMSSVAPGNNKSKPEINKHTMDRVNDHMRNVDMKLQIKEQTVVVENDENAPQVNEHPDNLFPDPVHPHGVVMLEESNQKKVIEEIGEKSEALNLETNPEERVAASIQRDRFISDYNEKLEEAQVEEFLARARADGWEVKLNSQLEIVSVRKIKPKR